MPLLKNLLRYEDIRRGRSVLDIGTSNIYGVSADDLVEFLRWFGCAITPEVIEFAKQVEVGSGRGPDGNARNQAWLGQILDAVGMPYDSIDVVVGYQTRVVDLNCNGLPPDMVGKFDLILNCGTTEHIFNQFNAFRCIHDATRPGGLMFHQLPTSGHTNHGYFCYTPRFLFDLAGNNNYEVVDFWLDGPDGHDRMYAAVRDYANVFPILKTVLDRIGSQPRETEIESTPVPNYSVNVVLRKPHAHPFHGMLELSTAWSREGLRDVPPNVRANY